MVLSFIFKEKEKKNMDKTNFETLYSKIKRMSLQSAYIYKTPNNMQYLHLKYIFETKDGGCYELIIPAVTPPFITGNAIPNFMFDGSGEPTFIDLDGYHTYSPIHKINGKKYTLVEVESPAKEMTLSEIEKELGYKIKLKGE